MKGKFVTIEGCEGTGKSTVTAMLKKYCAEKGINAVFTREPGGTPISEKIRALILDAANEGMTETTELLLYTAARCQHTEEFIKKALDCGKTVFCDRYTDSTLAYQGYGRGLDISVIQKLNEIALGGVKIDLTLFLDLNPEQGFIRKGGADASDRVESAGIEFHKRVYEGYKFLELNEKRFAGIDASKDKEQVFGEVIEVLKKRGIF